MIAPRHLARLVPRLQWALLGALALLVVTTVALPPGGTHGLVDSWLFFTVMGMAVVLAALRPVLRHEDRLPWALSAVGMLCWLAGDIWWQAAVEPLGSSAPSPNASDALYLLFYPCAGAGLLLLAARHAGTSHRALWLDGLVAGLGAGAAGALAIDLIATRTDTRAGVLVDLVYPFGDLVLLALVLAVLAAQSWRLSRSWYLMSGGAVLLVAADLNFVLHEAAGDYVEGGVLDLGWPTGFALVAMAAWQPGPSGRAPAAYRPALVVPTLVAATAVGVLVASTDRPVARSVVLLAAVALLGAVLRTGLAFRELRSLVESRHLAVTDELTGLGNRRLLQDQLSARLAARRHDEVLAVLLLDLDRFKEVNDALGHHVGDELLRQVGARLRSVLREGDVLARLGGDEFAVLVGPDVGPDTAEAVTSRIRDALVPPFGLEGVQLHVGVSVGVALCPDHAGAVSSLLQCADVAMYEAKRSGSGSAVYSPDRDRHDRDRLQTIAQLHAALAAEPRATTAGAAAPSSLPAPREAEGAACEITCHYQPQCDLTDGRIVGVEALVRWDHPERGLLAPDAFLGLAGQVGLMTTLTSRVLALALADCARWRHHGRELTVSVNLPATSLSDPALPTEVARLLGRHGVPGGALVLEVTEDVLLVDSIRVRDVVARLHTLGVGLSMDDYGTGHSSLTLLRTLPVHELKLDRSYIAGLGGSSRDAAIVSSTVALAHALGLSVVAEGVETDDDWQELARLRCDRAQGHLLSAPLPAAELLAWLEGRERQAALVGLTGTAP